MGIQPPRNGALVSDFRCKLTRVQQLPITFGIVFGIRLLGEPLDQSFVAGYVLVVIGILMVTGYGWRARLQSEHRLPNP